MNQAHPTCNLQSGCAKAFASSAAPSAEMLLDAKLRNVRSVLACKGQQEDSMYSFSGRHVAILQQLASARSSLMRPQQ